MKHSIALLILLISFTSTVYSQGLNAPGTSFVSPTFKAQKQNVGNSPQATPTIQITQTKNQEELRTFLEEQERILDQERERLQEKNKLMKQDQDRITLGVKVLLKAQEDNGSLDPHIAQLANQVQNTVQNTLRLEERIRDRKFLIYLFWGGDRESGQEMSLLTSQNQERIREMERLVENCSCDAGIKNLLQEQLRVMNQEQTRMYNLAQNEIRKKGLFFWL